MRILHGYIFREFRTNLLSALMVFTTLMFLMNLLRPLRDGFAVHHVARFMLHYIPYVLTWSIPMSVLTATVTTFAKFAESGELIAIQSGGIHAIRLMKTVLISIAGLVLFSMYANTTLIPESRQKMGLLKQELGLEVAMSMLTAKGEKVISVPPYTMYVDKVEGQVLRRIDIQVPLAAGGNGDSAETLVMRADSAQIDASEEGTMKLQMQHGQTTLIDSDLSSEGNTTPLPPRVWFWDEGEISLTSSRANDDNMPPKDMTISQLFTTLKQLDALPADERNDPHRNRVLVEIQKRLSLSVVSLVFAFIGAPLGMLCHRSTRVVGFAASLFLALGVYYPLLMLGQSLAKDGLNPIVALWAPNVLFIIGGILLFRFVVRS